MIASGESILDIAAKLKEKKARRIFAFSTFGLFVDGLDRFDEFHQKGLLDRVFTTNLVYGDDDLQTREWYTRVDMSKYVAYLIDTLNYDNSISELLNPVERIKNAVNKHKLALGK